MTVTDDELAACIEGKFAKYWMPDKFLFVEQIPRTSTGKFLNPASATSTATS